jgi:hypothetical protein
MYNKSYDNALQKTIIMILISILLNILCDRGYDTVAWFIVFIPFILMSIITGLLIYYFGLNTQTGDINYNKYVKTDNLGNILIYNPNYNPNKNPVYYNNPNIVVPNPAPVITQKPIHNKNIERSNTYYNYPNMGSINSLEYRS